ncbi:MAG: YajQ family cyclic di-GMP-binding protein [Methylococcaceae bacterium]|nr:YajQ family cyclic di-GMP-binding protein [Methylococcaceae bacterium]MCI0668680.1 YajQ family cyclic di-GMP-binding protein [Methylococcaceae bacterium]MCI0733443.1 YajQ family cyclic di-GMP-binding protein [Methylococcaceae bacterium]
MPSFDVVSEVDMHEAANAVDQANREVSTRFDFKGSGAEFDLNGSEIMLRAEVEFQLQQMLDILQTKLTKRGVDIGCMEIEEPRVSGKQAHQKATLRQGLDTTLAKKIVKMIKDSKLKVQASVQGDKVRVSGKKRDDLQQVIALLKDADLELPLQYNNFRD